jgi:methionine-gamma-lyase
LLQLTDIQAVCARVRAVGEAVVMVDNTLATPIIQRPLTLGADLVMHSLTKSVGGHSDITGGLVAGDRTRIVEVWRTAFILGATLDPFAAWLALRGLRTLELRVLRQSQTALAVAERLAAHPKISAVHYPGLASHPQATLAQRQMPGGGGGVLSFEVEGGLKAAERVVSAMRRAHRAASFGSVSTLVVHPAAMWAGMMSEAHLHEASVPPGLIRLGVGLDGAQGVIDDIEQALSHA